MDDMPAETCHNRSRTRVTYVGFSTERIQSRDLDTQGDRYRLFEAERLQPVLLNYDPCKGHFRKHGLGFSLEQL